MTSQVFNMAQEIFIRAAALELRDYCGNTQELVQECFSSAQEFYYRRQTIKVEEANSANDN